jgi:alpha-beta hydrolase superfamily lysophospholipase
MSVTPAGPSASVCPSPLSRPAEAMVSRSASLNFTAAPLTAAAGNTEIAGDLMELPRMAAASALYAAPCAAPWAPQGVRGPQGVRAPAPPQPQVSFWLGQLKARLTRDVALVQAGEVHGWCQSYLELPRTTAPRGMALLLHGFSAGPWQYENITEHLTGGGLAVYAPRLPGHGCLADGQPDSSALPGMGETSAYGRFAEAVYQEAKAQAQALGAPLYVMGFSLGGALALDLATRHPHSIKRLVVGAPLVRPQPLFGRLMYQAAHLVAKLDRGREYLKRRLYIWAAELPDFFPRPAPGYSHFTTDKLYACLDYAHTLRKTLQPPRMPVQLVVTEADRQCDPRAAQKLIARCAGPHHTYVVDRAFNVTHTDLAEVMPLGGPVHMTDVAVKFLTTGEGTTGHAKQAAFTPARGQICA